MIPTQMDIPLTKFVKNGKLISGVNRPGSLCNGAAQTAPYFSKGISFGRSCARPDNRAPSVRPVRTRARGDARRDRARRGPWPARRQAIKRYVADNLGERGLTVGAVATRHSVTPRYVQRLFESEAPRFRNTCSMSAWLVHRMLSHPHYARWTVSAIALEAGFGDVSYFNRGFRQHYGVRPSDVRAAAPFKA